MTKMYLEEGSDIDLDDIEISEEVENEIWQNIQLNREMQKLERKVSFRDTANSSNCHNHNVTNIVTNIILMRALQRTLTSQHSSGEFSHFSRSKQTPLEVENVKVL